MTIKSTYRKDLLSSHKRALQRCFVIPISKTPSAVLGEFIAKLRSDARAKKKEISSHKSRHYF